MKIKTFVVCLFAIVMSSCSAPRYLPDAENIDIDPHGSYIKIFRKSTSNNYGELIEVDSNKIVVLSKNTGECTTIPITDVERFKLRYAKPKDYGWSIPVFTLATISHGFFALFTAPLNLIVTASVTASGFSAFTYKEMTIEELRMFARFPQGIPPGIEMGSIQ